MLRDKDIALIEKYLSGDLTEKEKERFTERKAADKSFADEVIFRENLKLASERIVDAEFKSMMNDIRTDYKQKRTKKIYLYGIISLSAAALLLLFLLVISPIRNQNRIEMLMAKAEDITTFTLPNISKVQSRSVEDEQPAIKTDQKVAFIIADENQKYYNSYFFNEDVLYLFKQPDDSISFFYQINLNGKRVYYMCRDGRLYKFGQKDQDKIFKMNIILDTTLKKLCD